MDDFGSKLMWVTQNEKVFEVEEILTNILSRLPVKSLLVCKSVCKYWQGLICSPSFMHLHLIQSQENPSYVFYPSYVFWDNNIHWVIKTDGETTQSFPSYDGFYFRDMICSFNGLICCTTPRTVAHAPSTSFNHVCINGTVYWFSRSRIDGRLVGHILAVDREEKFSIIRIPEEETLYPLLVNLEGCLCLVAENGVVENRFDIWALQNSKETWREFNWEYGRVNGFSPPLAYTESLLPCHGLIDS
ncbi:hypothetical protein CK203_087745 [Vitis vinifera]|uniref:F-box domain-containing protein n=1 Tax=Vitis vinifera TaxID=29760 RepID=A0A438DPG4_VITVI|nr:hypothetical protein CK203_087745 [Vitis vinifera]